ncbi:kinase-like protein [Sanghuangporus baumii]|uniref:Kinase-like protein n=1 Tax=Sanghuangporus baumii TaxID=108892 RepID=A0A9Q5N8Z6_SANBA|nr:kinase-like protein [Sanghuangporus baumii]
MFSNGVRAILSKGSMLVDSPGLQQGKSIVLKTINASFARKLNEERRERLIQYFEREAGIWRLTSGHSNILELYGFMRVPGQAFPSLVSPYYEDGDLRAFVEEQEKGNLPAKQCIQFSFTRRIVALLVHSLTPAVIHRDLKASNVLVRRDGEILSAVLIDFGSAKISDPSLFRILKTTCSSSMAWSPPEYVLYPEKYTNPTAQGDMWSLACTCIEIFTGKDPYKGYDVKEALANGEIPQRPNDGKVSISDAAWCFLKKCWGISSDQRPCAKQAVSELEQLVTIA